MKQKNVPLYYCTKPCANCPYRTDAPLQLWHIKEFEKVKESEESMLGSVFSCHKNNGSVCVGWLIKQDEHRLPSIALRISLSKNDVDVSYLDKLKSPAPLYDTWQDMIKANYPELLKNLTDENI